MSDPGRTNHGIIAPFFVIILVPKEEPEVEMFVTKPKNNLFYILKMVFTSN